MTSSIMVNIKNDMSSFLEHLENNENILLMYLAGELPGDDRAEVETMLQNDSSLRKLLEQLQGTYDDVDSAIKHIDAQTPLVGARMSAANFGKAVRQRHADSLRPQPSIETNGKRMSMWIAVPLATAACLAIGMFAWWKFGTDELDTPSPIVQEAQIREYWRNDDAKALDMGTLAHSWEIDTDAIGSLASDMEDNDNTPTSADDLFTQW